MTIDPQLVTRTLLLIAADLSALEAIRDRGADANLQNWIEQAVVERYLGRVIGRMMAVRVPTWSGAFQNLSGSRPINFQSADQ